MPKEGKNFEKESFGFAAYAILLSLLLILMLLHLFRLYPIVVDKFTFYIISLVFVLLLLPIVRYIKFFGLVEVRKEIEELRRQLLTVKALASRAR
ncbi:MAG: hypothetical protein QXU88_02725 [Candidatus Woesearchaeota archaeon]